MDNRGYIANQYHDVVSDFICAKDEDEKWDCRCRMAKLEELAVSLGCYYDLVGCFKSEKGRIVCFSNGSLCASVCRTSCDFYGFSESDGVLCSLPVGAICPYLVNGN